MSTGTRPRPSRSARRARAAAPAAPLAGQAVILAVLTLLAYLPSTRAGFIWDDDLHVTANLITQPGGLWRSWFTTHQPNYWPVTWSAFWVEWKLFGMNPAGYHVVNILLHALNAVLAWRVLARLAIPGAWAAALVFALHPVNVETAAWITQLKTLLSTALYFGALLCYFLGEEQPKRSWYGAAAGLFAAGLLAKPSIVMLPVVLLLCAWWRRGRITREDLLRALPFFALSLAMSLTEIWFQNNRSMSGVVIRTDGFFSRLASAGWVVWFYLGKALVPVNLSFVYPRWEIDAANPLSYVPGLALVGLTAAGWYWRRSWGRPVLFALAYFTVTLFPVLGFFNIFYMRYSFVADHWQYVALLAPLALVTGAAAHFAGRLPEGQRRTTLAAGGALAALLFAMTWTHQASFNNLERLYRDTIARNDRAVLALGNLASLLYKKGQLDEAISYYEKALAVAPDDPESHAGLGNALFDLGRYEEALAHYRAALPLMPAADRFKVHFEMAETCARLGRTAEAIAEFEQVLRLRPDITPARQRLQQLRGQ